jgi:hypothetical protein
MYVRSPFSLRSCNLISPLTDPVQGTLSKEELEQLKEDYKKRPSTLNPEVYRVLRQYDRNNDGEIDENEAQQLLDDIKTTDTLGRYAGYTSSIIRAARYLAYTSDFGEAFRPIAHPRLVTLSYAVSWAVRAKHRLKDTPLTHGARPDVMPLDVDAVLRSGCGVRDMEGEGKGGGKAGALTSCGSPVRPTRLSC